jgi:hypothetical protein
MFNYRALQIPNESFLQFFKERKIKVESSEQTAALSRKSTLAKLSGQHVRNAHPLERCDRRALEGDAAGSTLVTATSLGVEALMVPVCKTNASVSTACNHKGAVKGGRAW